MKSILVRFLLLLLFVTSLPQNIAIAHHSYGESSYFERRDRHITSTHLRSVDELFCVDTKQSSLDLKETSNAIRDILYERNYDYLGNKRINFYREGGTSKHCSDLTKSELKDVKIRYIFTDNTAPYCGSSSYSCAVRPDLDYDKELNVYHCTYGIAYIRPRDFQNLPDYIINHETGHLLGMPDGGPNAPDKSPCQDSIMHSADYGCSNGRPKNPTAYDLATVENETYSD